jgi:hypothetical protein
MMDSDHRPPRLDDSSELPDIDAEWLSALDDVVLRVFGPDPAPTSTVPPTEATDAVTPEAGAASASSTPVGVPLAGPAAVESGPPPPTDPPLGDPTIEMPALGDTIPRGVGPSAALASRTNMELKAATPPSGRRVAALVRLASVRVVALALWFGFAIVVGAVWVLRTVDPMATRVAQRPAPTDTARGSPNVSSPDRNGETRLLPSRRLSPRLPLTRPQEPGVSVRHGGRAMQAVEPASPRERRAADSEASTPRSLAARTIRPPVAALPLPSISSAIPPVDERIAPPARDVPTVPEVPSLINRDARAAVALDTAGVHQTLSQYADAYHTLNVGAAAEVWPSVDRQALERAFATLRSQALLFEDCAVSIEGSSASASCRGTIQYVPKVGNSTPHVQAQHWIFRMRKMGADWKIEQMTGSQLAGAARRLTGS